MEWVVTPSPGRFTPGKEIRYGQNNCPKHVELAGTITKPLLLHLAGCQYYVYFIIFF